MKSCGCGPDEDCNECFRATCGNEGYVADGRENADGSAFHEWQRCGQECCRHGKCPDCDTCPICFAARAESVRTIDPEDDIAF